MSILSDGINNVLDTLVLFVAAVGFYMLASKESPYYPHGLGRIEYCTATLISLATLIVGVFFAVNCAERLFFRNAVVFNKYRAIVLGASVLIKLDLAFMLHWANKHANSPLLKAAIVDSVLDSCITAVTLASYASSPFFIVSLDAIVGVALAVVIFIFGLRVFIPALLTLIGKDNRQVSEELHLLIDEVMPKAKVQSLTVHDYGVTRKEAFVFLKAGVEAGKVALLVELAKLEHIILSVVVVDQQNHEGTHAHGKK